VLLVGMCGALPVRKSSLLFHADREMSITCPGWSDEAWRLNRGRSRFRGGPLPELYDPVQINRRRGPIER